MKKAIAFISVIFSLCLLFSSNIHVKAEGGGVTDISGPVMSNISMNKNGETLKSGDQLTFTFNVEDESSVFNIRIYFVNKAMTHQNKYIAFDLVDSSTSYVYNSITEKYDMTVTLPEIKNGKWEILYIALTDEYNNDTYLTTLPELSFIVTEGITDITAPVISDISNDMYGKALKAGESFTMSIAIEDESSINCLILFFHNSSNPLKSLSFTEYTNDNSLTYNTLTGRYETIITLPSVVPVGEWFLQRVTIQDAYFNTCIFNNTPSIWDNTQVYACRFIIANGITDIKGPVISDITIEPNGETLACGDLLIVSFRAEDESIIDDTLIIFANYKTDSVDKYFRSTIPLPYNDITDKYEVKIILPDTMKIGEWVLKELYVADVYDNGTTIYNAYKTYDATLDSYIYSLDKDLKFYILDDTNATALTTVQTAQPNSKVTIALGKATVIPKNVFALAKTNNIDMVFASTGSSYTWEIKGSTISTVGSDIDLSVKYNTSSIPSDVVNTISGSNETKQISLAHIGDFGFTADLSLNVTDINAGKYANLYYYNNGSLVFMASTTVNNDGSVCFTLTHASNYLIVLSDTDLDPSLPSFTITASTDSNGSISPNGVVSLKKNRNQTYTITANSNYKISYVEVDGINVGAISTYTFHNIITNHIIKAYFIADSSSGGGGGGYSGGGGFSGGGFSGGATSDASVTLNDDSSDEEENDDIDSELWSDISSKISKQLANQPTGSSNTNAPASISVEMKDTNTLPQSILQQIQGKNIVLNITLDDGITWIINGNSITKSSLGNINLDITLNSNAIADNLVDGLVDGNANMQLSLQYKGQFGFIANIVFPLGKNYVGKTASLYYFNPSTKSFEICSASSVDSDGNATLDFSHASDYVIVIDDNVHINESVLSDFSINAMKATLYVGGTTGNTKELSVSIPDALSTIIKKGLTSYTVTFSSDKDSVASVSDTGVITANDVGNATITTTITVGDTSTSIKTEVTVRKAYIKLVKYKKEMKVGMKASFTIKLYGYKTSEVSWLTSKKNIINVGKNNGKLTAQISAVSIGTDYLLFKINTVAGSTVVKQLKIIAK